MFVCIIHSAPGLRLRFIKPVPRPRFCRWQLVAPHPTWRELTPIILPRAAGVEALLRSQRSYWCISARSGVQAFSCRLRCLSLTCIAAHVA
jgi:hypothetical protein